MDTNAVQQHIDSLWDDSILPSLAEYIRIPNKSPMFDPDWAAHGYMEDAVKHLEAWAAEHAVAGMQMEVVRLDGRTPVLFAEIPASGGGSNSDTALLYGHYDKQPEFIGWEDGLAPWEPVFRDGKLYGRGGADDGYAMYGCLAALGALQAQGLPHNRCVMLIEGCEESGSFDLPHYMAHLADRIGTPSLVVCLDSGAGNYDQLWLTTSLRGMMSGNLTVRILTEGVHSGLASGIVPSTFRIARQLLNRVEDPGTGEVLDALQVQIPPTRIDEARAVANLLGDEVKEAFPWVDGAGPVADNPLEQILNNCWRPTLSITGAEGFPNLADAGNVLRPESALKLSFRLPPTADAKRCAELVAEQLLRDAPYGADVSWQLDGAESGWAAPVTAPWLERSLQDASQQWFGAPAMAMGLGGTIPFMKMLGDQYPGVQFVVTGVLGPHSNAHGPNEFLHIAMAKKVTACVANVLVDHARRASA